VSEGRQMNSRGFWDGEALSSHPRLEVFQPHECLQDRTWNIPRRVFNKGSPMCGLGAIYAVGQPRGCTADAFPGAPLHSYQSFRCPRCSGTTILCVKSPRSSYMCKVTAVILHGVVSPELPSGQGTLREAAPALLSHTKCFKSRFTKVNFHTNPSTYSLC